MELVSKLWKKRVMIIKWCVVGAVIGLVVGFSIPKTYSASVTLAPETQQKSSSLSGMASMFGVNLNNSVDAISVEMFPDVVHSTPFIVDLFELPVQFERKDSTINTTLLDYMKNYQKCAWWSYVMNAPFKVLGWCVDLVTPDKEVVETVSEFNPTNLPKDEREVVKFFANNIIVNVDKKTGKTSMSLLMQDPLVVAQVMEAVTDNLKTYMSNYRTSKARQDVANLSSICEERKADYYKAQQAYAKFVDANKNVILQSAQAERERLQQEMNLAYQVYSQVASQLEGSRIEEQQAKPVFTIIHPVIVPISRTAPSKAKMLVIFTFLAGCCAAAWVLFGDEYWQKLKENIK
jgi:LPS O-antigen subunit length determinant protein (WzzB/FepE family)